MPGLDVVQEMNPIGTPQNFKSDFDASTRLAIIFGVIIVGGCVWQPTLVGPSILSILFGSILAGSAVYLIKLHKFCGAMRIFRSKFPIVIIGGGILYVIAKNPTQVGTFTFGIYAGFWVTISAFRRIVAEKLGQSVISPFGRSKVQDVPKYHIALLELKNLIPMKELRDKRPFRLRMTAFNQSGTSQEIAYNFRDIGMGVGAIWVEPTSLPQSFDVFATGDLDLDLFEAEATNIHWLDSVWPTIWPKCLEAARAHQVDYGKPVTEEVTAECVSISPPGDYIDFETEWWRFSFVTNGTFVVSFDEALEIQDIGAAF